MILGKVSGSVHMTIHHPFYDNRRLLIVDLLDANGNVTKDYLIAVDSVDAGFGEIVLIINEGNSSRQIVGDSNAPIRSMIVGIVDQAG